MFDIYTEFKKFFSNAIDKMKNHSILNMEVVLQWGMQNF